ncbi:MAG: hypothetical protein K0R54_694 [Clostridiaceae bacterium]|jgi:hypothetical protein|nr:hypothetical protein [Clostridiaceae bacterium]
MKLKVNDKFGDLFTNDGIIIRKPAILIDKNGSLMKFGEAEDVKAYYNSLIDKMSYFKEDYVYVEFNEEFNEYKSLTYEDICTIINYGMSYSLTGNKILNILSSEENVMREEIENLKLLIA